MICCCEASVTLMVVVNSDGRDDGGGGDECVCFLMTRFAQAHHGAAGVRRHRVRRHRVRRHSAAGGGRWGGNILCPDGRETCPEGPKARQKKNAKLDGTITVASLLLIGSLGVRKQLGASLKPYFAKLAWF